MNYVYSEKEFLTVYNSYKPNGFTKFMYKYFSAKFSNLGTMGLVIYTIMMNVICIIIDQNNNKSEYLQPMMFISNIPFFIWGICATIAFSMNQSRHKKIMKKLGIIKMDDYNNYVKLYVKHEFE